MAAADSNSENAIVDYLNERKKNYGDKGLFVEHVALNISVEASEYNAITKAIKEKLKIVNEQIKLIILELKGKDKLVLDCDAFLLNYKNMVNKNYYNKLNHVIIGKTGDTYDSIIGYIETVKEETTRPRATTTSAPCTTFKLKDISRTCALLPGTIKNIIFQCITQHYNENTEPAAMKDYYNPTTNEYKEEVAAETKVEANLAAAQAAAEIKEEDKCDFKTLLKSKIKNESNEYCKVTDPGLLERIKQNIDGDGVNVNVDGLNELINTRIKKVTDEGEEEEDEEEKDIEDGKKTISENKEATMIREANEMFMISRKVLSKGATYSSSDFFKQYLPANTMVNEQEEKAPENPVAAPTVIEAPVATTGAPVTEAAAATTTEATTPEASVAEATAPDATAAPASVAAVTPDKLKTAATAAMAIVKAKRLAKRKVTSDERKSLFKFDN